MIHPVPLSPSFPLPSRYVYQRQYESGGQMWPFVAHKVVGCNLILVLFTAMVLFVKQAYAQFSLLVLTLPIFLLWFNK